MRFWQGVWMSVTLLENVRTYQRIEASIAIAATNCSEDDSVMLDASLQPAEVMNTLRVGQVLAEQSLLAIVPSRFDARQTEALQRMEAHLCYVTDRALPRATKGAMGLALLCIDPATKQVVS
jgi:hypothetical protein